MKQMLPEGEVEVVAGESSDCVVGVLCWMVGGVVEDAEVEDLVVDDVDDAAATGGY